MSSVASPRRRAAVTLLLLVATAITFAPSLAGGFVWDDQRLIVASEQVRDLAHLPRVFTRGFWELAGASPALGVGAYYRPVVAAALALEFALFGLRPFGYHAVNIALHLACTALAAQWLAGRLRPGAPLVAPALGAALFALHPSRVESVAWISGASDLWATLFALLALLAWQRLPGARGVVASTLAVAAAALCKESALVVPLLLVVERERRPWRELAPPFAALGLALTARALALGPRPAAPAEGLAASTARVLSSLGHLTRLIVVPWPPTVMPAFVRFTPSGAVAFAPWSIALGALVALGLAAVFARARRSAALRPWARDLAVLSLTLAPALNLVPLRLQTLVAPRFLYLPLLGVAALGARALASIAAARVRPLALAACAALLLSASLVVRHTGAYASTAELWTWELAIDPDNHFALQSLSLERARQGRAAEALDLALAAFAAAGRAHAREAQVDRALDVASRLSDLTPESDQATLGAVRDFFAAFAPDGRGPARLDARGLRLRLALSSADRDGRLPHAWRIPFAVSLARTLAYPEAEAQLRAVLRDHPGDALAGRNLPLVIASQERWSDALAECVPALRANPADALARELCASIARAARRADAPAADPLEALARRGERLLSIGARERARRLVAAAADAHPDHVDLALVLLRADLADGHLDRARARLASLASTPTDPRVAALRHALDRAAPP